MILNFNSVLIMTLLSFCYYCSTTFADSEAMNAICRRLSENCERIDDLRIVVDITTKSAVDSGTLKRFKTAYSSITREDWAIKGPKRRLEVTSRNSGDKFDRASVGPAILKTLEQQEKLGGLTVDQALARSNKLAEGNETVTSVFDGKVFRRYGSRLREGLITPENSDAQQRFQSRYLSHIGYFVNDNFYSDEVRGAVSSFMIPQAFQLSEYKVQEVEENGMACLQLSGIAGSGSKDVHFRDLIWLSKSEGLRVTRREWRELDSNTLKYIAILEEPKEILPALWLPTKMTLSDYGRVNTNDKEPTLLLTTIGKAILSTPVPESLFEVDFPSGTKVLDYVTSISRNGKQRTITYTVPANKAALDAVITSAMGKSSWLSGRFLFFGVAVSSLLACLGAYKILNRNK